MMLGTISEHHITTEVGLAFAAACTPDEIHLLKRGYAGLNISIEQAILLGMKPSRLMEIKKTPAFGDWGSQPLKPLAAAAFFAQEGDSAEAHECLDMRQRAIFAYEKSKTTYAEESAKTTWVLPPFYGLGLPELNMNRVDSFLEAGAFTLTSIEEHLDRYTDTLRWSLAKEAATRRPDLFNLLQTKALKKAREHLINGTRNGKRGEGNRKPNLSYKDCAEVIRMCGTASANHLMSTVGGTKSVIGAMYDSGDDGIYLRGLAVLARGLELNREVLPYLIRGPTLEEIKKFRGIGIAALLHDMAWEYVEPLISKPGFKGLMLPFIEKLGPSYLRNIIVNHPNRIGLKGPIYRVVDIDIHSWPAVSRKLSECYNTSIRFRQDLVRETGDPIISWMFMLGIFDQRQGPLDKVLGAHPNIRAIRKCLSTYSSPVRRDPNKSGFAHT